VLVAVLSIKLPKVVSMVEEDNVATGPRLVLGGSEPLEHKVETTPMDIEIFPLLFI